MGCCRPHLRPDLGEGLEGRGGADALPPRRGVEGRGIGEGKRWRLQSCKLKLQSAFPLSAKISDGHRMRAYTKRKVVWPWWALALLEFLSLGQQYFIVIDDMREELWCDTEHAFPADDGVSSRIVVTTNIQSIANACSTAEGYVYKMGKLNTEYSKGSEQLRKKCDGLPLALICVGQFLLSEGTVTGPTCSDVCSNLGHHLENKSNSNALARMQRVLTRSYTCLSGDAAKACLLYLGMFPGNHSIRRKRLLRRWLAEGLVKRQPHPRLGDSAVESFKMLMDQNIVQPVDVSNNEGVKTCQLPGMMLEFIMHRSISEGFITIFRGEDEMLLLPDQYAVRCLSVQCRSTAAANIGLERNDLSLLRSLTVSGEVCQDFLDFKEYKLLQVLDLEECDGLMDGHLDGICKLLLLKYLSIGGAVTTLPKMIGRLKFLETFDVRRTKVEVVIMPAEVLVLPKLVHLFGKFELSGSVSNKIQQIIKSGKSNLQILSGFVAGSNHGFVQLMCHMKNLRKVKIWCKSATKRNKSISLSSAIQKFIENGNDPNDARSLSVDFSECSEDILQISPRGDCNLRSLKLYGELQKIPKFFASLLALRELYLSSTTIRGDVLTALSELRYLVYLKLIAENLEDFMIKYGAFQSLQRLCFVIQRLTLPGIQEGALPQLVSLQLIYENLANVCLINIGGIKRLKEVMLDSKMNVESKEYWEGAAKKHPNRPKVLCI
uniref:Disease resistance protein n=1 Tax=Oryza sativa subsp. japonica TaxID=39947 RepID=Q8H8I7_ORYSJ|nr:putative disease resistance gene [Oryza sativa Japonica Group]